MAIPRPSDDEVSLMIHVAGVGLAFGSMNMEHGTADEFTAKEIVYPASYNGKIPLEGKDRVAVINGVVLPFAYIQVGLERIMSDMLTKEFAAAAAPPRCPKCNQSPCVVHTEEATEIINDVAQKQEVLAPDDYFQLSFEQKKMLRFECYKRFYTLVYGIGKKGERKPLPDCVVAEIHDYFPKADDEEYVGFRPSSGAAAKQK